MKTASIYISYRLTPKIVMLSIICAVSATHPPSAYGVPADIEFVQSASTVDAYDFVEVTLRVGKQAAGNPFTDVVIEGWSARDGGQQVRVDGFCDSADGSMFCIRFMPTRPGRYDYRVRYRQGSCENTHSGEFSAEHGKRRGLVRVDEGHPWHFFWEGTGEHYFWNATTTYWLLGWDDETIRTNIDRLHKLKVNRLRAAICGRVKNGRAWFENVFPTDKFSFRLNPWVAQRPDSVENPGFDVKRFNIPHWQKIERMLRHARDRDMNISIIIYVDGARPGVDPFGKKRMGQQDEQRYYRYAVACLAAFSNVMWDVTNEYHLFRNEAWANKMGAFIKKCDPYDHLMSVHGHGQFPFRKSPWADFAMYQQWDESGGYQFMLENRRKQAQIGRPIPQVNEEYGYEDHYPTWGGNRKAPARSADNRRRLAWGMYMAGCYQTTGERAGTGTGWGPYEHTPPSQWKQGQETSESYRRCCTSVGWVAQALALRLMHAEKSWNHDAFFDYVDRWMYEDDAAFVKTIREATGKDHDKEWARQGQAWDAFVNEMWAKHRPTLPALPDGWKQRHDDAYYRTAVAEYSAAPLPPGVKAVWDLSKAYRETTPTRERICINGLWRWQPAEAESQQMSARNWGYFKVPGCWPGVTDYMQKDSQTVRAHPSWRNQKLGGITAAWYERQITIPTNWAGRRIAVYIEYLNSYAVAYVDGTRAGETRFPGGEVDLTSICHPGDTHRLSLLVVAMPLKGVVLSYTDTASARQIKGSVARRGLCGDVYLVSTPRGPRIADVKVDTSVRRKEFTFDAAFEGLSANAQYAIRARVLKDGRSVKEFTSRAFQRNDLKEGRIAFTQEWMPDRLWDTHTPQNTYNLEVSLLDAQGKVLDTSGPVRFGFREFWIDGRDFFLNGTRILLSAVPLDNAQVGAALANYEAARESLERLKSFGINFVYTHNYGCEPGSHLSFAEILRAADDVGMLVSFSQPHFSHYDWQASDADQNNGYARHAEFYVRAAQNHPSVVMYSMSHNATGYSEDMNPDMIDGIQDARDTWALRNAKRALRAEAIVKRLDPSRIVYHHASGNLGSMHAINFYPNFVPVQELSDWFEHWATQGVKPVFMCEYGGPFTWDWAMYRGWYKGKREFGGAVVPWEFCLAEWNAQFFGDRAFQISDMEKENLRWEAKQFREGRLWHRWDYPHRLGSTDFPEREPVFDMYYTDNWRAFRTWGVSANSPWEHHILFKLRPGMDSPWGSFRRNRREELKVDWVNLQRPGFSPDYKKERYERMDLAYERSDWIPTAGAKALIRNNRPLLAYIGGKPACFTSKDHLFVAGETVEKQIIVINNSRVPVRCDCSWLLALPQSAAAGLRKESQGQSKVTVETGQQARIPMRLALPAGVEPGKYKLSANVVFSVRSPKDNTGEVQEDEFMIHVLPRPPLPCVEVKVAVFDPEGETTELLKRMGVHCDTVDAKADLGAYDMLIVGKTALTVDGPAPDIGRVRDGLKVILFEQTPDVLEKRLGFRVAQYGLRNVFKRVPDHPVLAGLQTEHLRDWRGEATILPPRLRYELHPKFNYAPTVTWCGIPVTRAWRCGHRGNVASVLIEKPACGDFLPIVDGGFGLQYSPLLEYREGNGVVLFCQMDVTGRTQTDPAAQILTANILEYVSTWKPSPRREVFYVGEPAGRAHFQAAGFLPGSYGGGELEADQVLIVGPGSKGLAASGGAVGEFLKAGGHLLAIGLTQQGADALLPFKISLNQAEHINACFDPPGVSSLLAGVGPADVHNRDPRTIPLVSGGAKIVGNGVLAVASGTNVVFCQLAPWQFEYRKNFGLKRTFRRTSFLVTRLLGNLGVSGETPLLTRLSTPVGSDGPGRWLQGFYLDGPEEWDDPYRFFRW